MPSNPRQLPWFLDVLLVVRSVSAPADRPVIDQVRRDLGEDLREDLRCGLSVRRAYFALWRRTTRELAVFVPRAKKRWLTRGSRALSSARRVCDRAAKPLIAAGLASVLLLSAKSLWFDRAAADDLPSVMEELQQVRAELQRVASEGNGGRELRDPVGGQRMVARLSDIRDYFVRTRSEYGGRFYLAGLIGIIDEELGLFWEAAGDRERSTAHQESALTWYVRGVESGDPIALYHLGVWYLDRGQPRVALPHLRRAHERWPLLRVPGVSRTGHVASTYYYGLLQLYRSEGDPSVLVEALPLERHAIRALENGAVRESTREILYNAACLRALMVQAGALESVEGIRAVRLLELAFDAAGEAAAEVAGWQSSDPDLKALRSLEVYERVKARADAALAAAADHDEGRD